MDEKCVTTSTDLTLIIPNLYLGSIEAACNTDNLQKLGITHILTIDDRPLSQKFHNNFKYKFIRVLDVPYYDILGLFNECFQFIDDGIKSPSAILIHCLLGVSRSATVVLAYLMLKNQQTLNDTYEFLNSKRYIRPNNGFIRQLELFEAMNYEIDNELASYKSYKLEKIAEQIKKGANIVDLYVKEKIHLNSNDDTNVNKISANSQYFKCRKCRFKLFSKDNLIKHIKAYENMSDISDWNSKFVYYKKLNQHKNCNSNTSECNKEIFIEPVSWLIDKITNLEGKINCPKCDSKLGSYNWYGFKCSCNTWVVPAFHISESKVDAPSPVQLLIPQLASNELAIKANLLNEQENNKSVLISNGSTNLINNTSEET